MQTVREKGDVVYPNLGAMSAKEQRDYFALSVQGYTTPTKPSPVTSPTHYKQGAVEVIDFIDQTVDGYADGRMAHYVACALKYLARAPHKGKLQEDLAKAEWYITRAVNRAASLKAP